MAISKQTGARTYRKITPRTVAEHQAQAVLTGNATQAVRTINPEYVDPSSRAVRIARKSNIVNAGEFIDNSLQQIGAEAIERIGELVHSEDERIATKNAQYVVDHIRGKAVQRSIGVTARFNIQNVLD